MTPEGLTGVDEMVEESCVGLVGGCCHYHLILVLILILVWGLGLVWGRLILVLVLILSLIRSLR